MQTQILGLVTPLMALLFAGTFAVLWYAGRMKRRVLGFAASFAFSAIGFLVTHFSPSNAPYVWHTTQLFYSLGTICMIASLCDRAGLRPPLVGLGLAYATSAFLLGAAIALSNDVALRLILVNIGYGVMFTIGATMLFNARGRSFIDVAIIAVMVFQAFDFLVRPTMTLLFERSIAAEVYRESIYYSMIGLALGVKGVTTALVLTAATFAEWTSALREKSERDNLTGLRNRGAFMETMEALLPKAQKERRPLSLVVADIDNFKQVNDIWGHQAGDQALAAFGDLVERTVRASDVAARIGGEEFCIAVWNCDNEPAAHLADRIRLAFAKLPHDGLSDDIRLTASFGVATARDGEDYDTLFSRADAALYQAKAGGRNKVQNAEDRRSFDLSLKDGGKFDHLLSDEDQQEASPMLRRSR